MDNISTDGTLVVWGPVVWDSRGARPSNNPYHKGIPEIQTTNEPLVEHLCTSTVSKCHMNRRRVLAYYSHIENRWPGATEDIIQAGSWFLFFSLW